MTNVAMRNSVKSHVIFSERNVENLSSKISKIEHGSIKFPRLDSLNGEVWRGNQYFTAP